MQEHVNFEPEFITTQYLFGLHSYLEIFQVRPSELTWRDWELYQLFLATKNEFEREKINASRKDINA